ncbi:MAG: hypothetical protein AB1671_08335 [Thermodesulfobacteriota bacterium]|jgi:hypothetical protein
MAVDFLKTADFLQEELQTFYRTLRCGEEGGNSKLRSNGYAPLLTKWNLSSTIWVSSGGPSR